MRLNALRAAPGILEGREALRDSTSDHQLITPSVRKDQGCERPATDQHRAGQNTKVRSGSPKGGGLGFGAAGRCGIPSQSPATNGPVLEDSR